MPDKNKKSPFEAYLEELEAQENEPTEFGGFLDRSWDNVKGIPEGVLDILGMVNPANLVQDGARAIGLPSGPPLPGSGAFGRMIDRVGTQGRKALDADHPLATLGHTAGIATEAIGLPAVRAGEEFGEGNIGEGIADTLFSLLPGARGFVGKGGLKLNRGQQPAGPKVNRHGLPEELGPDAYAGPRQVTPPELLELQRKGAEWANSMPEWRAEHGAGLADNIRSYYERTDSAPRQTAAVGELSASKISDAILRGQAGRVAHGLEKNLKAPRDLGSPRLVKTPEGANNPLIGPQNINSVLADILVELTQGGRPKMARSNAPDLGQTRLLGKPRRDTRIGRTHGQRFQRDLGTLRDRQLMPDQQILDVPESNVAKGVKGKDPKKRQDKKSAMMESLISEILID